MKSVIFAQCQTKMVNVFYVTTTARQVYCKRAIKQMVKALQGMDSDKKNRFLNSFVC